MGELETFAPHPESERHLYGLTAEFIDEWPASLELATEHFVALVACDPADLLDKDIAQFAKTLIGQGARYIAVWGPDCERVHDVVDETVANLDPDSNADSVILTEWHDDESFAEAVYSAVHSNFPASDWEPTCNSVVVGVVGSERRVKQYRAWLSDPEALEKATEEDEPLEA
jgi:hypothetical protein